MDLIPGKGGYLFNTSISSEILQNSLRVSFISQNCRRNVLGIVEIREEILKLNLSVIGRNATPPYSRNFNIREASFGRYCWMNSCLIHLYEPDVWFLDDESRIIREFRAVPKWLLSLSTSFRLHLHCSCRWELVEIDISHFGTALNSVLVA